MMNVLFALLLLAGLAFLAWRVAGLAYWFRDLADKVGGLF